MYYAYVNNWTSCVKELGIPLKQLVNILNT